MSLKILIADDEDLNRLLLFKISKELGYEPIMATNGREAVDKFAAEQPDLILMDVMMPEVSGTEATATIKSRDADVWVPIIILSALSDHDNVILGLRAGADDYITKPLHLEILRAKLRNFERSINVHRQLAEQNNELRRYHFESEDEKRVANHLMQSLIDIDRMKRPGVEWWLEPAGTFSGDVLAAAPTPSGVQHLLLADATGHGLAAALSAQPLPEIFYAMTARGYSIGRIAQEINRRVCRMLPVDRFFTATLVAINSRDATMEVWNGGNPAAIVIDHDSSIVHTFQSRHFPLGVLRNEEFNANTEHISYPPRSQLIMMSDGLAEFYQASNRKDWPNRLLELLARKQPQQRMQAIKRHVSLQHSVTPPDDDISLFVISMDLLGKRSTSGHTHEAQTISRDENGDWKFKITFSGSQLRQMHEDVVPFLLGTLEQLADIENQRSTLFLLLSELFNNSLDHGLLRLDSQIKREPSGFDQYYEMRSERLARLEDNAFIDIRIELTQHQHLSLVIRDSGPGFDYAHIMQHTSAPDEHHGRGIRMLKQLGLKLKFQNPGNVVSASIALKNPSH